MFTLSLVYIFLFSLLIYLYVIFVMKGVCFLAPNRKTDHEKILTASKEINFFDWPSKMHSINYNRSQLREYWIIAIKSVALFYKNKLADHININVALLSNIISIILFFLILEKLFSLEIAIIFSLFYATALWPYHVAIYWGHIHLSQALFLLSVFFLILYVEDQVYLYSLISGMFIAASLYSSSSSRKYPLVYIFLLMYFFHDSNILIFEKIFLVLISLIFLIILFFIIKFFFIRKNKINHIYQYWIFLFFLLIFLCNFNFNYQNIFLLSSILLGFFIIFLHIFLPIRELGINLVRYNAWFNHSNASHFNAYPDKQKVFGKDFSDNFRGGGLFWYHKLFSLFLPTIYFLFIISFIFILTIFFKDFYLYQTINFKYLYILVFSLLPLIIHELTKGLKVGKALMSNLIFLIFLIVFAFNEIINQYPIHKINFFVILSIFLCIQFFHSAYFILTDIIPCRMASATLYRYLTNHNVKEFYTYDNAFNNVLVKSMIYTYPNAFNVIYIKKMSEVKSGVIVIPSTSAKSVNMETEQFAILNGDYDEDEELNALLTSNFSDSKIIGKIKTMGTSKYFAQESEVTSYRDLILNQINKFDRYRGNAWIIKK